jgi:hypothetical protein
MDTNTHRNLILPSDVRERVSRWHGGQWTACYKLASNDLVSVAMVEDAADELDRVQGPGETLEMRLDREDLVDDLRGVVDWSEEHEVCSGP